MSERSPSCILVGGSGQSVAFAHICCGGGGREKAVPSKTQPWAKGPQGATLAVAGSTHVSFVACSTHVSMHVVACSTHGATQAGAGSRCVSMHVAPNPPFLSLHTPKTQPSVLTSATRDVQLLDLMQRSIYFVAQRTYLCHTCRPAARLH